MCCLLTAICSFHADTYLHGTVMVDEATTVQLRTSVILDACIYTDQPPHHRVLYTAQPRQNVPPPPPLPPPPGHWVPVIRHLKM